MENKASPKQFRFQDLEIWRRASEASRALFILADSLENQRLFRFAEQLRAATLSISNNIAEGSGSASETDFANFLNISRRSVFDVANMLMILSQHGYLKSDEITAPLSQLEEQSKMLLAFRRTLRSEPQLRTPRS